MLTVLSSSTTLVFYCWLFPNELSPKSSA